jgi:hypothetical protein
MSNVPATIKFEATMQVEVDDIYCSAIVRCWRAPWKGGAFQWVQALVTGVETDRVNETAAELVSLAPDAIVVTGTQALRAVKGQTQKIPIRGYIGRGPGRQRYGGKPCSP